VRRPLALALVCLAATASGDTFRQFRKNGQRNTGVVLSYLRTVASSDECTGTSPTTAQGGSLTFTRASSAFCQNTAGTLVLLSSDQPRIQPAGLLVEAAATNACIRSEALDNAAWTNNVLVVTANSTVAPDGTTTADTLDGVPDDSPGSNLEGTAAALTGGAAIASLYVKTASGTQAMAIRLYDSTAAAVKCTGTITATTTWQRVKCLSLITSGNDHKVVIYPGGVAGVGTIYAWGAMMEVSGDGSASGQPSSYIATAGTSVTRALDNASLALPSLASETAGCIAVTISAVTQQGVANQRWLDFSESNPLYTATPTAFTADDGVTGVSNLATTNQYSTSNRVAFNWAGASMYTSTSSGSSTAATYGGNLWGVATLYIGSNSGTTSHANLSLSNIKVGTIPGRCL